MAALLEGHQYGLSSQAILPSESKSLVFVKLTDSALKAVEDYLKFQGSCYSQPRIQVRGNSGQLIFPTNGNGADRTFNFSLSPNTDIEGPQGSFECVQQCGSRSLESLGPLQYKMRIQAKEDVYEVTRQRMAVAEEESKKNCTQVIKASGPDIGRRVKLKKPITSAPVRKENSMPPFPSVPSPIQTANHESKRSPLRNGYGFSNNSQFANGFNSHNNFNRSQTKTTGNSGNPDLMRRPIRDRIIHLLAVRSYKKPELLMRLYKDGIKDKDKKSITQVLSQISLMKDNSYSLLRHVWNDVQEDWPFFTEQDKLLLKRRKPQNLTPPGSDSNSSCGQSPTSTNPCHSPNPAKRPSSQNKVADIPSKKQRISHYKRPDSSQQPCRPDSNVIHNNSYNYSGNNGNTLRNSDSLSNRDNSAFNVVHSNKVKVPLAQKTSELNRSNSPMRNNQVNGFNTWEKKKASGVVVENGLNKSVNVGKVSSTTPGSSPDSQLEGLADSGNVSPTSTSESPEYLSQYTTISSLEQRSQYKVDFNTEYVEYRDLHAIIDKVSKKFAEMEEKLRQHDENSQTYKNIKNQIVREYHENKKNEGYQNAKRRFQYLHDKLYHIKRLVMEYDSAREQMVQS